MILYALDAHMAVQNVTTSMTSAIAQLATLAKYFSILLALTPAPNTTNQTTTKLVSQHMSFVTPAAIGLKINANLSYQSASLATY